MKLLKVLFVFITVLLASFYLFPFSFVALPGINTKMAMAACSLLILLIRLAKRRESVADRSFITLSAIAIIVSLICFISVVINNTNDHSYSTYIVSMWVWLGGAYTLVSVIRAVHGDVTMRLICNYMIAVCVLQCVIALLIDLIPEVKFIVNTHIGSFGFNSSLGASEYERRDRLYGIGAALDFAGTRFSAVLIMIAVLVMQQAERESSGRSILYVLSFMLICVIGNMIARTTSVGAIIAIIYVIFKLCKGTIVKYSKFLFLSGSLILISIVLIVSLYNTSIIFKEYIEFGFEGFFSLVRTGEWQTNSGDILINMIRFPETWKTWLIGDGYFENPNSDIYYVGYPWKGFYMGTDIGYLRFIFYFGVFGLIAFSCFFCVVFKTCSRAHPQYRCLFGLLLVLNFIIWLKVSTDIFVVFAPFLCFTENENTISDPLDI